MTLKAITVTFKICNYKLVQERKEMLAGERKGLTRSGRKVVARYKNGFVASTEQEVFTISYLGRIILSAVEFSCVSSNQSSYDLWLH